MGERRIGRGDVPTRESPGADLDVVFAVVEGIVHPNAQGEELQQLTAIVLVEVGLVALGVVQVVHHAWVGGELEQQIVELAHPVLAEDVDHQTHLLAAVNLAVTGTENHVPEKGYLLLKLAGAVDHAPHPLLHVVLDGSRFVVGRVVANEQVFLDGLLALGIE